MSGVAYILGAHAINMAKINKSIRNKSMSKKNKNNLGRIGDMTINQISALMSKQRNEIEKAESLADGWEEDFVRCKGQRDDAIRGEREKQAEITILREEIRKDKDTPALPFVIITVQLLIIIALFAILMGSVN